LEELPLMDTKPFFPRALLSGAVAILIGWTGATVQASGNPAFEDESVTWAVDHPVSQDFAESSTPSVRSLTPVAAVEHPGIHQLQQEVNDALGLKSEADFDALAGRIPLAMPRLKTSAAQLQKQVFGWHPYWMGTAYQSYDYSKLSTLAYFSYEVNPTNGSYSDLHDWNTTPIIAWAHSNDVKVVLTATLFGSANNETLLTNAASRANLINSLVTVVSNRNGDGVNIDFESVGSSMKPYLTTFMSNLTDRFHQDLSGSEVSAAIPAVDWSSAYDVGAYEGFIDYVIIMGYGYHWSGGDPGPVAPLSASSTWGAYCIEKSIDDYLALGISAERLLLGCPYYGYNWPVASDAIPGTATGSGTAVIYSTTEVNEATYGRQWDASGSVPYYMYTNASVIHQTWYEDVQSLGLKYDMVNSKGIGGIGIWALGYDAGESALWELLGAKFGVSDSWQSRTSGTTDSFYGAGANNGDYAAVGAGGLIHTSTDGLSWLTATSGVSDLLMNVEGASGTWVAVGDQGRILTSSDGVTWTSRTTPTTNMLRAIAYGNGVYVAGGADGMILRSTDAVTWATQTAGTAETIQGISYVGGQFIAVGVNSLLLASTDGATWTSRTSNASGWLLDTAYGDGTYVAVGLGARVVTSPDATTWTRQTNDLPATTANLYRVAYGNGQFVAVGQDGVIWGSTNGTDWVAESSDTTNFLRGLVFSNNQFVAVGYGGTLLTKGAAAASVAITTPGATVSYATTSQSISGTANTEAVGSMSWTNSLGGSGSLAAATNWTFSAALSVGTNVLTVTATNTSGANADAQVTFIRESAAGGTSGVVESDAAQPVGGLSDIIVYTSGGHGVTGDTGSWVFGRGLGNGVVEDVGNADQLSMFVEYCFKAGATVVPMRPVGNQTNEVVLDNTNAASVTWGGSWNDSTSPTFYGDVGATPYRYAYINATTTTAWAVYRPTIPVAGFYPVYAWSRSGLDRVKQLYRVYHSGGVTDVHVNHRRVGLGWVWLGFYYFEAGTNGSVNISNYAPGYDPGNDVVIADAIRFGNGMGDIDRGSGVSGLPRKMEGSRYWVQAMTGQGMSSSLYDNPSLSDVSDNVGAPPRMAAEMNRESDGGFFDRIYLGFHSNAHSGTSRGPLGLYDTRGSTTKINRQKDYGTLVADELENDLGYGDNGVWFPDGFYNSGGNLYGSAYGELYGTVNAEMNSTIIEVAFHDNADDANLLKDPVARRVMAMASYQAIVKHLTTNNPAVVSPILLPDPPTEVCVANNGTGILTLKWSAPVTNSAGGDAATGYTVYRSTNGYGFGNPVAVSGEATTTLTLTNLPEDTVYYFQVCATNIGGESLASKTVGARVSPAGQAPHLVVNGFERNERRLSPTRYYANGVNGQVTRVIPREINAQDYVIQYAQAIEADGRYFDSCDSAAVAAGDVDLTDYFAAYWILGRESSANETFSSTEQTLVSAFLAASNCLFVSGTEIGWDLDHLGSAADKAFCTNQLKTAYSVDDAGTGQVTAKSTGFFSGLGTFSFDYSGTGSLYRASYPDVLLVAGVPASASILVYGSAESGTSIAGVGYSNTSKQVVLGFPFETILDSGTRDSLMAQTLGFFGDAPSDTPVVEITTTNQTLAFGTPSLWVSGTNNAAVTGWLSWSNDLTSGSGSISAGTNWSVPISLTTGVNTITVSGDNYLGTQTDQDTLLVTVEATSSGSTNLIDEPFDDSPLAPSGWTFNDVIAYSSSAYVGRAIPSVKFDSDGDSITSLTFSGGTNLQYWMRGVPGSGTVATGTFVVAQNIGGTWSTLETLTNPSKTGTTYSVTISTSVIQLRFTWNKTYGNIALDDVIVNGPGSGGGARDTDGDGIPDDWETDNFGGPTNAIADADSDTDGADNYDEYIAGTGPNSSNSVLAITSFEANTNTATLVFRWPSVTGRVYSIWMATNALNDYTQHIGSLAATAPTNGYTNMAPSSDGTCFYGVRVTWPDAL